MTDTLVDPGTGEVVVLLDKREATKLTAEIKAWAGTLWLKIEEAHRGQAWRALGYGSWAEYLRVEFDISRSRGYQLVAHAQAVRQLAEAAGIEDVSTIVDTPEGVTRGIDLEAAADEVRERTADLPEDATDEDKAEVVERTTRSHSVTTKPTATTAPTPDGSAQPSDEGAPEPEGEPQAAPAGAPADPPISEDPYPDLTYAANFHKAHSAARRGLLSFDAEKVARVCTEDMDDLVALASDMCSWAEALLNACDSRPNLRSV